MLRPFYFNPMHMYVSGAALFVNLVYLQGGPKNGLFLRSDNFAPTNDGKARNTAKVSEFRQE